jgi:hypothetical protein
VFTVSPDGRRSAFVCAYATGGEPPWRTGLYLVDGAPEEARRVADEVLDARGGLAWSPDGRRLAYFAVVDLGPAPVAAGELRVYDAATGQTARLDQARHFVSSPVWASDGSVVVYRVGSWQHSAAPVETYRAPLDGGGGAPWVRGAQAAVPGPGGRWLGVREPRDREGLGEVVVVGPDGAVTPLTAPGAVERPLGWLGADPVVWRQTAEATARRGPRGDVWLLGPAPRRLLADVPRVDALEGSARLEGELLGYVDGGGTAHEAHLPTGRVTRIGG